jgi:hypothetical protein
VPPFPPLKMKRNNQKLTNDQKLTTKNYVLIKKHHTPLYPSFMSKKPHKITNMKILKMKKYNSHPSPPLLHQQLEP